MENPAPTPVPAVPGKPGLFNDYLLPWQMAPAERCALLHVLRVAKPAHSIGIGTAQGGSLSAIARFSGRVYTLDKEAACADELGARFPNAVFLTGRSSDTLPPLVAELAAAGAALGFALIDGSHERARVRADIENLLAFRPAVCPL